MSELYRIDLDHEHREHVESLLLDIERWVVPVTEPLLTREEAANDPQVREMIAQFILKASGWG